VIAGDAVEIKKRSIRQIGCLIDERGKAGTLAKPPIVEGPGRGKKEKTSGLPAPRGLSLADQGVDKNLAKEARKTWKLDEAAFSPLIAAPGGAANAAPWLSPALFSLLFLSLGAAFAAVSRRMVVSSAPTILAMARWP